MYERIEYNEDNYKDRDYKCKRQTHVHEYLVSTRIAEREEDPHNHRFAGVTGEAEQRGNSHVHRLRGNSDFYENHFHTFAATTGPAIPVGGGDMCTLFLAQHLVTMVICIILFLLH